MTEHPNALWLMIFSLLYGCVPTCHGLPYRQLLNITAFDCKLNIEGEKWTMECESQDDPEGTWSKFFLVKLRGLLDLRSPLSYKKLLHSTSLSDSEFHSCDKYYKYFLKIDPSALLSYCDSRKKYHKELIGALKVSSVRSLNMSHTSKPHLVLNILYEFSRVDDVIISNNAFSNLSSLPAHANSSLIRLSLKENKIKNLTDGIFSTFHSLSTLDLSHNLLKQIRKELFDCVNSLSELDISYNLIESISSDAFSNLVSLKKVYLRDNNLKSINEDWFRYNNFLSVIDMSDNDITYLPATLLNKTINLKNISCSNCNLLDLDKDIFINSPNLVSIDFSYNHLSVLRVNVFNNLKFLQVVHLGNNNISYLSDKLFPNQPFLMYLNLTNNEISFLKEDVFQGAPNIRYLDLSRNNIEVLNDDHIRYFSDLEYLGLNHNRIGTVELGIKSFVKIRKLHISDNRIKEFVVKWKQFIFLEILNMDNNRLTNINLPPCIPSVKQTLTFSFKHNKISKVNINELMSDEKRVKFDKTMSGCFFNGLSKNFVDLTHNPLICDCRLYPFYEYVRQKSPRNYQLEMFIDKGNLTCAYPPHLNNRSLVSLPDDALNCALFQNCPPTCRCGMRGKDNLTLVNCSSRNLAKIPQIIPVSTTVLYADGNKLTTMTSLNIDVWVNLRELHLDNNLLADLDDWKIPPSLRYLSVRGNRLKTLPQALMQFFSSLSNFQLFFGNNNKNCDCDRESLKNFLLKNIDFVKDNEDILCSVTNNSTSVLLPLISFPDRDLCPKSFENFNSYQKRVIISLCVFFTLLILSVLLYYRQRQLILSFCYIHCDELFRVFYFEEEDDDKIFDAFVAYSSSDREIVLKLLQELEDNSPSFRLCIHERNWLPGRFITDNIVDSVESSKRTIVILSNNFILSPWFNLELRAAVFKMSKDRMNKIIVILTEKSVSLDSIDSEIRHVISKRTYLVWGERWFWEKLRYAMPRKRNATHACRNNQSNSIISDVALLAEMA